MAAAGAPVFAAGTAVGIALLVGPNVFKYLKKSKNTDTNNDKKETNSQESEKEPKEIKNILIVGITGAGKSTLANVIFGKEQKFEEVAGSTSGTQENQKEIFEWEKTKYRIIDTIGQGNVSELTDEEVEKRLGGLINDDNDIRKNGISQILLVFKDRFTKEQIKVLKWLKEKFHKSELLYSYITLISTNFADFEDETKCEEDKKKLLKLKDNEDIIEIISNCKLIHINNPPTNIRGKDKTRTEKQNSLNRETREIAREILLYHLKTRCEYLHSLPPPNFNTHLEEFTEEEIMKELDQLENKIEVPPKNS